MNNDPIGDALNMNPLQPLLTTAQKKSLVPTDYEYARGSMISVIEKGNEALSDMLNVAQQSQQPRAYEVVATLLKTIADTNKDLLELQKKHKDIENMDGPQTPQTINNNLFVGSTAELQKLIKQQNEQE
jgi:hypothetical protein